MSLDPLVVATEEDWKQDDEDDQVTRVDTMGAVERQPYRIDQSGE